MIIEITGKQHIAGISSKTGKPYDFTDIYYLGRRKNVEGLAAVKKTIGADIIASENIVVGGSYDVDADDEGNIIEMHRVSKPASNTVAGQQTKG